MYMDDITLFAKNEKELKTLIEAVKIYTDDQWKESFWLVGWLFGFFWHINHCRLFNTRSILYI